MPLPKPGSVLACLGDAGPGRFCVVAAIAFPSVAVDAAGHDRRRGLFNGHAGRGRPGVVVGRWQGPHGTRTHGAEKTGEVSALDAEAHVQLRVAERRRALGVVSVAVADSTGQLAGVVLCMGAGVRGIGEENIGRGHNQHLFGCRRVTVAVIARTCCSNRFEADIMGMAFGTIAIVVVILPGDFRGAVLMKPGVVVTYLAHIGAPRARAVVIAEHTGHTGAGGC